MQEVEVHRPPVWWQRDAPRQVPRPRRRRLAAGGRGARLREAASRSRARSCAIPRATSTRTRRSHSTVSRCGRAPATSCTRSTSRRASCRPRATRTGGARWSTSCRRARRLYPVGRLDADSTGLILLTNDGELANLLTHPRYEVPRTYRGHRAPGAGARARAARRCARASSSMTARRPPRGSADSRPTGWRSPCTRAASARSAGCARRSGIRWPRSSASRSGRCGWARLGPGEHRRLTAAEVAGAAERRRRSRLGRGSLRRWRFRAWSFRARSFRARRFWAWSFWARRFWAWSFWAWSFWARSFWARSFRARPLRARPALIECPADAPVRAARRHLRAANEPEAILSATEELMREMLARNAARGRRTS